MRLNDWKQYQDERSGETTDELLEVVQEARVQTRVSSDHIATDACNGSSLFCYDLLPLEHVL